MSSRDSPPHRRRSRSPPRRGGDRDRGAPRDREPGEYRRERVDYRDDDRGYRGGSGRGGRADYRDHDRGDERRGGGRSDWRDDRRDDRRGDGGRYRDRGRDGRGVPPPRERDWDRDRPLDRRAIEEGRRRREEERARGVVFTADGQRIEPKKDEPEEEPEPEVDEDIDDETRAMQAMMGFGGFGTTKGVEVEGNEEGTAKVNTKRTWRQYMNRRGGFNRALDKMK